MSGPAVTVVDLAAWRRRGETPALYLEPGGDEHVLGYRDLADAVRRRSAELAAQRPAGAPDGHPLVAVEGHRPVGVLVECLASLDAGWSVLVVNGGWWPRERDALYERLQPDHVVRVNPSGPSSASVRPGPGRSGPAARPRPAGAGPLLWIGSAGGEGDPRAHAFTAEQVRTWLAGTGTDRVPGGLGHDPAGVLVTGDLGHLATLRTVLAGLAAGTAVQFGDRTHLAAQLAHRRHAEVVTTPLLLRRALRQLARRGRQPAGAGRLVLHQGQVRPHEWAAWTDRTADVVESGVSVTEAGGWLLHGEHPAGGVEIIVDADGSVACAGAGSSPADAAGDRPAGGWRTGDVAERRADGSVHWRGRRRDRFVADGGHEVDPVEVEAVIAAHPLVAEVAVAPRPHPERGNLVVAVVVPADPEWPPFLDDLAAVTGTLPGPARPSALAVVDDLPLNAAGAVHRRLVNYEEAGR